MIRSLAETALLSLSANPVTVVIAMPEENAIPISPKTFAADVAGMTIEKNTDAPAVGVEEEL